MQTIGTDTPATYSIHWYPARLIQSWELPNGRRVTLRPVLPQDDRLLHTFVEASLSPESRRRRFHRSINGLTAFELRYLTQVNYQRHLGLIVTAIEGDDEVAVAEARYFVAEDGETAEFALAVADAWQALGIGKRVLIALQSAARQAGLRVLSGDVLATNDNMLGLLKKFDFTVRSHATEPGVMKVERSVAEHRSRHCVTQCDDLSEPAPAFLPGNGATRSLGTLAA